MKHLLFSILFHLIITRFNNISKACERLTFSRFHHIGKKTQSVTSHRCQLADVRRCQPGFQCFTLPQDSTVGPLLYLTDTSKLQEVAERHGVAFRSFADDTQLSKSAYVEDIHSAKQTVTDCVLGTLEQLTSLMRRNRRLSGYFI